MKKTDYYLWITFFFLLPFFLPAQIHPITIHTTNRVASLLMTTQEYEDWINNDEFNNQSVREALFQDIYQKFQDDFDFIFLVLNEDSRPSNLPFGQLIQVSNDVSGLGLSIFDNSSNYGSSGQLKAVMQLTQRDFLTNGPSLHELMHNWGNFGIPVEAVAAPGTDLTSFSFIPHWGFTGGSSPGQLGGFDQSTLVDNGGNNYTVDGFGPNANGGNSIPFNELELYLMGMIPVEQVTDFDVFTDITALTVNGGTFDFEASTRTTYNASALESLLGTRSPSSATSQKNFRLLVLVLTDTDLTTSQWDLVDLTAERLARNEAEGTSSYNFWEATGGLGTLDIDNLEGSVVLPVDLISFEAKALNSNIVQLNWTTATEKDNDYFTIQRSADAKNWEDVIQVQAIGNSNFPKSYESTDFHPLSGTSFYRLKQTDFGGKVTYSYTCSVEINKIDIPVKIYPIPARNEITIEAENIETISLFNTVGQLVVERKVDAEMAIHQLDVSEYEAGIYFLKIKMKNGNWIEEKIVVK